MDIIVRYWDEESAGMKVRYLDLKFMLRRNICEVDGGWKLLQMSRDGPHVNWSVKSFMDIARAEKSSCYELILEAGGLHVIHGAFEMIYIIHFTFIYPLNMKCLEC